MTPDSALPSDSSSIPEDGILLSFPKGLLGFPELVTFRLFEPRDGYPLKFLQAVEAPDISFTCIDPASVKEDYEVPLGEEEAEALQLQSQQDALVLTLVVIPADPRGMTTNLAGPLVINTRTRQGFQIALNAEKFPLRFPILGQE
jgi:flagellar assembly factor FliW